MWSILAIGHSGTLGGARETLDMALPVNFHAHRFASKIQSWSVAEGLLERTGNALGVVLKCCSWNALECCGIGS